MAALRSRLMLLVPVVLLALLAPLAPEPAAATSVATATATSVAAGPAKRPAVIGRVTYGHSAQGRPLVAYHLGEPGRPGVSTVLAMAAMHGNEAAPVQIMQALVNGPELLGIDLWVIATYNPDGVVAGTRKNARGVDLNRNFPYGWTDLDGSYESGAGPASEPETKAMMAFLRKVRPDRILSFHQPLNGVDTDTKLPAFARRVAHKLHLPTQTLDCGGVCHGTMTGWYNHTFAGAAITIEYGARPGRRRMRDRAPDQLLSVFGAVRGVVGFEPLARG